MTLVHRPSRFANRALMIQVAGAIWRRARARLRRLLWPVFHRLLGVRMVENDELSRPGLCKTYSTYRGPESISIPEPTSVGDVTASFARKVGTWTIGEPWCAVLPDARLLGPTAVAFTPGNGIVGESVIPENYSAREVGVPTRALLLSLFPRSTLPAIDSACSMIGQWSKGYFEWLVEYLPRLEAVQRHRERTGDEPKVLVDANPTAWQRESLELLGYSREDLVPWNGRGLRVGSLLVPSFPRRLCEPGRRFSVVSPEALRWTRASILANLPPPRGGAACGFAERVVISRRHAAGRRVANEEEMMDHLSRRGFVAYVLEDLTFAEQVRLFATARFVIAPHGAGLANIVFSDGLGVIELYSSYFNASFLTLAAGLGFQYGCLECEPVKTIHPKRDDLKVEVAHLDRLVDTITDAIGNLHAL